MPRVEFAVDFKEEFPDIYLKIEELGSKVRWFKDRDKVLGLNIDLTKYQGRDLEDMRLSRRFLIKYIAMPAIEDVFSNDGERHNWLRKQDEHIREAYENNRLRGNNIGIATVGIDFMRQVFNNTGEIAKEKKCKAILDEIHRSQKLENPRKMSVEFADKLANGALQALELLT